MLHTFDAATLMSQKPFSLTSPSTLEVKEDLDKRVVFMAPASMVARVEAEVKMTREDKAEVYRRAVDLYFNPQSTQTTDVDNVRAPYLSEVPCGPWAAAIDTGVSFVVSEDIAEELEMQDGDAWCRASGQSMEGAGILDGFMVLLRPYGKKVAVKGEKILVQAFFEDAEPMGTIKRFDGMDGNRPKLLDGDFKTYELPEGTIRADIVARAVGVIGRI